MVSLCTKSSNLQALGTAQRLTGISWEENKIYHSNLIGAYQLWNHGSFSYEVIWSKQGSHVFCQIVTVEAWSVAIFIRIGAQCGFILKPFSRLVYWALQTGTSQTLSAQVCASLEQFLTVPSVYSANVNLCVQQFSKCFLEITEKITHNSWAYRSMWHVSLNIGLHMWKRDTSIWGSRKKVPIPICVSIHTFMVCTWAFTQLRTSSKKEGKEIM